jgi:hypothetical protein
MAHIYEPGVWKYRVRTVTDDQSVLAYVKWNPYRLTAIDGSTQVTEARMQVQANLVNFDINGVAETVIGTYSGNSGGDDQVVFADSPGTVRALIERINGIELGFDRYRAGLGDFRPGFGIGAGDGLAAGLTSIMLGVGNKGLEIFADSSGLSTANLFAAGCGTQGAKEGAGQAFPDLFEYEYTSTVGGVVTKRRAADLSKERTFQSKTEVRVTFVHFGAAFASNAKVLEFYDVNNTLLLRRDIGSATDLPDQDRYNFDNPIVVSQGPVFVQGSGSGALTDGALSVGYYERVA